MNRPDVIGRIVKTPATYDEDGNQLTAPEFEDGWHVNTPELVPEWSAYLMDPQPDTPTRVYQGGLMPVCYRFPYRETFEALLPDDNDAQLHP